MRIDSNEARSEDSVKADEVDLDLPDRTTPPGTSAAAAANSNGSGSRNRNKFPRLGLDALIHESRPDGHAGEDGAFQFYKVYKRRWFGLAQLTLLNIIISWDVSISPVFFSSSRQTLLRYDVARAPALGYHCI